MSYAATQKVKDAAESVSDSTLQNDDHLSFAIAANEVWLVEIYLYTTAAAAASDIKVALTVPTGATLELMAQMVDGQYAVGTPPWGSTGYTTTSGSGVTLPITTPASGLVLVRIHAWVSNGSTAGTVQLQWAQGTTDATATTVGINSHLLAHRTT